MILLETSLPCSENFYRFRKNFENILNKGPNSNENSPHNSKTDATSNKSNEEGKKETLKV